MRIEQLLEQNKYNSQLLLQESCDGLTNDQRLVVEGIYNELSPLLEVALTADQIKNIFQSVEKNATAAGGNRTGLGKGVDTARQVDAALNKLGKWLQNTTPVKNFDAKFEKLKANINKKFPDSKFLDGVSKMGIWAQNNPGKTAAIIGVLTTVAALAGGPVGGAIAGQILKGSVELLKGEKLSTAIGKGAKAAAYGFLAGKSLELIGDSLSSGIETVRDALFPGAQKLTLIKDATGLGFNSVEAIGRPEDLKPIETAWAAASKAWDNNDLNSAATYIQQAKDAAAKLADPTYVAQIAANDQARDAITKAAQVTMKVADGIAAAAQGAVTAKTGEKKESVYLQARSLSEGQVYMLFNRIEQLNEGPMWDKVKSGAGKLAAAAGQKISTVGTNLTTKITADKLNSAWTKAGSPTDSEALAKFLKSQGVDDAVISQTFKAMKLKVGDAAQTGYAQVRAQLTQLNTKQKRQLAAYLQKQLGTA
jgi:hypothetical protein